MRACAVYICIVKYTRHIQNAVIYSAAAVHTNSTLRHVCMYVCAAVQPLDAHATAVGIYTQQQSSSPCKHVRKYVSFTHFAAAVTSPVQMRPPRLQQYTPLQAINSNCLPSPRWAVAFAASPCGSKFIVGSDDSPHTLRFVA